jgi:hypothetical protein
MASLFDPMRLEFAPAIRLPNRYFGRLDRGKYRGFDGEGNGEFAFGADVQGRFMTPARSRTAL